jgi:hypothetical protein
MKFLQVMLVAVMVAFSGAQVANAAGTAQTYVSAERVLTADVRAVRMVKAYKRDGFQEAGRVYNQIMYLLAPTQDYKAGEYVVTLRKSVGNYSLTTYYAEVHVEIFADIETGTFYAGRVWAEESVVY